MTKTTLIIALLTSLVLPMLAGNSVFSYYGMPYQYNGVDIYSMGMGDAGSSDIFRYNTGYANPAQRSLTNRTLFSTGMLFGFTNYQSDTHGAQKFKDDSMDFPYFSVSVPIKNHRVGFQFNSIRSGVMSNQTQIEDLSIIEKQSIDRYMYRVDLLYSIHYSRLLLGVSGNYYFGHDEHKFSQSGGFGLFNTQENLSYTYKNPSATLGVIYRGDWFSFGSYYSLGRSLEGDVVRSSIHETEVPVDYKVDIPGHLNTSLTMKPTPTFKVALDFDYEPWSGIDESYIDSYKLSLGIAREPVMDSFSNKWWNQPIRTGISYRKLPFKAIGQNEIDEYSASLGVSLPLKKDVNRIDFGFKYTKRGSLETNKLQDEAYMFMIGFTGFDIIGRALDRTAPRYIPVKEDIVE